MFHILVVEDNANTRKLMEAVLLQNGYHPILACDGVEALEVLDKKHVDLIVLDIMMPRMDGYEFTRTLRESGCDLPILMVTAKEKPADIAALLRRSRIVNEHRLTIGNTILDYDELSVQTPEGTRVLPKKEFMLLFKLLSYQNKIFTRRQLMDEIWDMDTDTDERTVDVHINRLRDHFRNSADFEIVTVRGLGYKAVKRG